MARSRAETVSPFASELDRDPTAVIAAPIAQSYDGVRYVGFNSRTVTYFRGGQTEPRSLPLAASTIEMTRERQVTASHQIATRGPRILKQVWQQLGPRSRYGSVGRVLFTCALSQGRWE